MLVVEVCGGFCDLDWIGRSPAERWLWWLDDVLGDGGLKGADTDVRHSVLWAATVTCNNNTEEKDTEFKVKLHDARGKPWFVLEKNIASSMGFALFVALVPVSNGSISPCF